MGVRFRAYSVQKASSATNPNASPTWTLTERPCPASAAAPSSTSLFDDVIIPASETFRGAADGDLLGLSLKTAFSTDYESPGPVEPTALATGHDVADVDRFIQRLSRAQTEPASERHGSVAEATEAGFENDQGEGKNEGEGDRDGQSARTHPEISRYGCRHTSAHVMFPEQLSKNKNKNKNNKSSALNDFMVHRPGVTATVSMTDGNGISMKGQEETSADCREVGLMLLADSNDGNKSPAEGGLLPVDNVPRRTEGLVQPAAAAAAGGSKIFMRSAEPQCFVIPLTQAAAGEVSSIPADGVTTLPSHDQLAAATNNSHYADDALTAAIFGGDSGCGDASSSQQEPLVAAKAQNAASVIKEVASKPKKATAMAPSAASFPRIKRSKGLQVFSRDIVATARKTRLPKKLKAPFKPPSTNPSRKSMDNVLSPTIACNYENRKGELDMLHVVVVPGHHGIATVGGEIRCSEQQPAQHAALLCDPRPNSPACEMRGLKRPRTSSHVSLHPETMTSTTSSRYQHDGAHATAVSEPHSQRNATSDNQHDDGSVVGGGLKELKALGGESIVVMKRVMGEQQKCGVDVAHGHEIMPQPQCVGKDERSMADEGSSGGLAEGAGEKQLAVQNVRRRPRSKSTASLHLREQGVVEASTVAAASAAGGVGGAGGSAAESASGGAEDDQRTNIVVEAGEGGVAADDQRTNIVLNMAKVVEDGNYASDSEKEQEPVVLNFSGRRRKAFKAVAIDIGKMMPRVPSSIVLVDEDDTAVTHHQERRSSCDLDDVAVPLQGIQRSSSTSSASPLRGPSPLHLVVAAADLQRPQVAAVNCSVPDLGEGMRKNVKGQDSHDEHDAAEDDGNHPAAVELVGGPSPLSDRTNLDQTMPPRKRRKVYKPPPPQAAAGAIDSRLQLPHRPHHHDDVMLRSGQKQHESHAACYDVQHDDVTIEDCRGPTTASGRSHDDGLGGHDHAVAGNRGGSDADFSIFKSSAGKMTRPHGDQEPVHVDRDHGHSRQQRIEEDELGPDGGEGLVEGDFGRHAEVEEGGKHHEVNQEGGEGLQPPLEKGRACNWQLHEADEGVPTQEAFLSSSDQDTAIVVPGTQLTAADEEIVTLHGTQLAAADNDDDDDDDDEEEEDDDGCEALTAATGTQLAEAAAGTCDRLESSTTAGMPPTSSAMEGAGTCSLKAAAGVGQEDNGSDVGYRLEQHDHAVRQPAVAVGEGGFCHSDNMLITDETAAVDGMGRGSALCGDIRGTVMIVDKELAAATSCPGHADPEGAGLPVRDVAAPSSEGEGELVPSAALTEELRLSSCCGRLDQADVDVQPTQQLVVVHDGFVVGEQQDGGEDEAVDRFLHEGAIGTGRCVHLPLRPGQVRGFMQVSHDGLVDGRGTQQQGGSHSQEPCSAAEQEQQEAEKAADGGSNASMKGDSVEDVCTTQCSLPRFEEEEEEEEEGKERDGKDERGQEENGGQQGGGREEEFGKEEEKADKGEEQEGGYLEETRGSSLKVQTTQIVRGTEEQRLAESSPEHASDTNSSIEMMEDEDGGTVKVEPLHPAPDHAAAVPPLRDIAAAAAAGGGGHATSSVARSDANQGEMAVAGDEVRPNWQGDVAADILSRGRFPDDCRVKYSRRFQAATATTAAVASGWVLALESPQRCGGPQLRGHLLEGDVSDSARPSSNSEIMLRNELPAAVLAAEAPAGHRVPAMRTPPLDDISSTLDDISSSSAAAAACSLADSTQQQLVKSLSRVFEAVMAVKASGGEERGRLGYDNDMSSAGESGAASLAAAAPDSCSPFAALFDQTPVPSQDEAEVEFSLHAATPTAAAERVACWEGAAKAKAGEARGGGVAEVATGEARGGGAAEVAAASIQIVGPVEAEKDVKTPELSPEGTDEAVSLAKGICNDENEMVEEAGGFGAAMETASEDSAGVTEKTPEDTPEVAEKDPPTEPLAAGFPASGGQIETAMHEEVDVLVVVSSGVAEACSVDAKTTFEHDAKKLEGGCHASGLAPELGVPAGEGDKSSPSTASSTSFGTPEVTPDAHSAETPACQVGFKVAAGTTGEEEEFHEEEETEGGSRLGSSQKCKVASCVAGGEQIPCGVSTARLADVAAHESDAERVRANVAAVMWQSAVAADVAAGDEAEEAAEVDADALQLTQVEADALPQSAEDQSQFVQEVMADMVADVAADDSTESIPDVPDDNATNMVAKDASWSSHVFAKITRMDDDDDDGKSLMGEVRPQQILQHPMDMAANASADMASAQAADVAADVAADATTAFPVTDQDPDLRQLNAATEQHKLPSEEPLLPWKQKGFEPTSVRPRQEGMTEAATSSCKWIVGRLGTHEDVAIVKKSSYAISQSWFQPTASGGRFEQIHPKTDQIPSAAAAAAGRSFPRGTKFIPGTEADSREGSHQQGQAKWHKDSTEGERATTSTSRQEEESKKIPGLSFGSLFQTASGKAVSFTERGIRRARAILGAESFGADVDSGDCKRRETLHGGGCPGAREVRIEGEAGDGPDDAFIAKENSEDRLTVLPEDAEKATSGAGRGSRASLFQTASGKAVSISRESIRRAQAMFAEGGSEAAAGLDASGCAEESLAAASGGDHVGHQPYPGQQRGGSLQPVVAATPPHVSSRSSGIVSNVMPTAVAAVNCRGGRDDVGGDNGCVGGPTIIGGSGGSGTTIAGSITSFGTSRSRGSSRVEPHAAVGLMPMAGTRQLQPATPATAGRQGSLFQTASGKAVALTEEGMRRARQLFGSELEPDAAAPQPPLLPPASHLDTPRTVGPNLNTEQYGRSMHAGISRVHASALDRCASSLSAAAAAVMEVGLFQTASGRRVAVTERAMQRARRLLEGGGRAEQNDGLRNDIGGTGASCDAAGEPRERSHADASLGSAERVGRLGAASAATTAGIGLFQTASGKRVEVSAAAMKRAQAMLQGADGGYGGHAAAAEGADGYLMQQDGEAEKSRGITPSSVGRYSDGRIFAESGQKEDCLASKTACGIGMFTTASGKAVEVSDEALRRARARFGSHPSVSAEIKSTGSDFCDLVDRSEIDERQLRRNASASAWPESFTSTSKPSKEEPSAKAAAAAMAAAAAAAAASGGGGIGLFQTASGRNVTVSEQGTTTCGSGRAPQNPGGFMKEGTGGHEGSRTQTAGLRSSSPNLLLPITPTPSSHLGSRPFTPGSVGGPSSKSGGTLVAAPACRGLKRGRDEEESSAGDGDGFAAPGERHGQPQAWNMQQRQRQQQLRPDVKNRPGRLRFTSPRQLHAHASPSTPFIPPSPTDQGRARSSLIPSTPFPSTSPPHTPSSNLHSIHLSGNGPPSKHRTRTMGLPPMPMRPLLVSPEREQQQGPRRKLHSLYLDGNGKKLPRPQLEDFFGYPPGLDDGVSLIPPHVSRMTSDSAAPFKFKRNATPGEETSSEERGVDFFCEQLLASGAEPKFATHDWVANHYRWIVWKLACYERSYPSKWAGRLLTEERVTEQLRYRYEREVNRGQRSALRRICERDSAAGSPMVLVISAVRGMDGEEGEEESRRRRGRERGVLGEDAGGAEGSQQGDEEEQAEEEGREKGELEEERRREVHRRASPASSLAGATPSAAGSAAAASASARIEVTDGWYCLRARLDEQLSLKLRSGRLSVGQKIWVCGASLAGSTEGMPPLEAYHSSSLCLNFNGTRRAHWSSRLGFSKPHCRLPLSLRSVHERGGMVPLTCVAVVRIYPTLYWERNASGVGGVMRTERAEAAASRRFEERRSQIIEEAAADMERNPTSITSREATGARVAGGAGGVGMDRGGRFARGSFLNSRRSNHRNNPRGEGARLLLDLERATDPEAFFAGLSANQRAALQEARERQQDAARAALESRVNAAMSAANVAERDVVAMVKIRVVGVQQRVNGLESVGGGRGEEKRGNEGIRVRGEGEADEEEDEEKVEAEEVGDGAAGERKQWDENGEALVSIWRPSDEQLQQLQEGSIYLVSNLQPSPSPYRQQHSPSAARQSSPILRFITKPAGSGGSSGRQRGLLQLSTTRASKWRLLTSANPSYSSLRFHYPPRRTFTVQGAMALPAGREFDLIGIVLAVDHPTPVGLRLVQQVRIVGISEKEQMIVEHSGFHDNFLPIEATILDSIVLWSNLTKKRAKSPQGRAEASELSELTTNSVAIQNQARHHFGLFSTWKSQSAGVLNQWRNNL